MVKLIIGVVVGFIAWSIIWVGGDSVLRSLSPDWYGASQLAAEKAMVNGTEYAFETGILFINLVRSIIASLISGFLAAFVAGAGGKAPLWLGVILLLVGILVQVSVWSYMPIWYHAIFLILLLPVTVLGGKLKRA